MSAKSPRPSEESAARLRTLGEQLRVRRKAFRVSSTATAESAGISRVTLYRIEKGEPSVTVGAWANALAALGMALHGVDVEARAANTSTTAPPDPSNWIPVRIPLADYPQLKALAWQVQGTETLKPMEALGIYERNARHLDMATMAESEQALLRALRVGLGELNLPKERDADGV